MTFAVADAADLADAGAFLARVVRLDPRALVRLRPAARSGHVALWAWLPLDVLATRVVAGRLSATLPPSGEEDVTVGAAALLEAVRGSGAPGDARGTGGVTLPTRRDVEWRGALPGGRDRELEVIPADVVRRLVVAGEEAFRSATTDAQAAGEALLDHETLRISAGGTNVVVPLRMLLGLARMGFLGDDRDGDRAGDGAGVRDDGGEDEVVRVGVGGGWLRLAGRYGTIYRRADPRAALSLTVR